MAKIYGGRWRITSEDSHLGEGGQGRVFRVVDEQGVYAGKFALKRVLNPARYERFRREVQAIKLLDHPNIIKLVDHSALDSDDLLAEKQYLVMPIAEGGNLSKLGRRSLYNEDLDGALKVAKQIAGGLAAAHRANVIHRDIKPENILFTGVGHELWLADFGICLLREVERVTPTGEVVGPHQFMAPELDGGGKLDVTPSADIYSLGKVIFYLITGGTILPRERLFDEQYRKVFAKGERYHLLQLLLGKMICSIENRLSNADAVLEQLEQIDQWEQRARQLPFSASGLGAIENLQNQERKQQQILAENASARAQEEASVASVGQAFETWLEAQLSMAAQHIGRGGVLECSIGKSRIPPDARITTGQREPTWFDPIRGLEITIKRISTGATHSLQLLLCRERTAVFSVRMGPVTNAIAAQPPKDIPLIFLPLEIQMLLPKGLTVAFLSKRETIGGYRSQIDLQPGAPHNKPPALTHIPITRVMPFFISDVAQYVRFKASEWVVKSTELSTVLSEALDSLIEAAST